MTRGWSDPPNLWGAARHALETPPRSGQQRMDLNHPQPLPQPLGPDADHSRHDGEPSRDQILSFTRSSRNGVNSTATQPVCAGSAGLRVSCGSAYLTPPSARIDLVSRRGIPGLEDFAHGLVTPSFQELVEGNGSMRVGVRGVGLAASLPVVVARCPLPGINLTATSIPPWDTRRSIPRRSSMATARSSPAAAPPAPARNTEPPPTRHRCRRRYQVPLRRVPCGDPPRSD